MTFYEEARLIVPDGTTTIPQNYPVHRVSLQEVRARNKVRIKTTVSKEDLQYVETFPTTKAEQKIYKYTCPICLRYFNTILVASCCQNYLCRLCIGDLAKRAKKDPSFVITCCHCFADDYRLTDVDHKNEVKFYTDTPFK